MVLALPYLTGSFHKKYSVCVSVSNLVCCVEIYVEYLHILPAIIDMNMDDGTAEESQDYL